MARGRKRKPTATKEASGAYRKNPQRRPKKEPKPILGMPDCPDWVRNEDLAYEEWQRICTVLQSENRLNINDSAVIAMTANTFARWRELDMVVAGGNVGDIGTKGSPITRPEAAQTHKYADRYLKLITELGITPASRSKVETLKEEKEVSGFGELLASMGAGKN
jgi:P27 family predicted phage terminase small subunit